MIPQIKRNPAFHANWAALLADFISGPVEVNITGDENKLRLQEFSGHYLPWVIFSAQHPGTNHGVAENQLIQGKTFIFVCKDKTCFTPVETVQEALNLLEMS
jgi:uncharacterized protein